MEFGLFLNGYLPGPAAHDSESEHTMLMRELATPSTPTASTGSTPGSASTTRLVEYSHMSAPETVFGYITAKTEQIHVGSGIMNLSRPVNHPVRNAERVAMLDHVTEQPLRVGHRPRRRQPRDGHLRPAHLRDQGHVGRGRSRDPAHVGAEGLHVRGRVLPGREAPQHPPQALRHRPPAAVGRLRQPRHLHQGRRARHRRHRLQLRARSTTSRAASTPTRRASPTAPSRSASS